jgi:ppGpp synthetase/RelA/SpoT-type nucleotidyltranferase
MAGTSRSKTKRQSSSSRKAQPPTRTPDEIWQRNPEIIKQFLQVRRDYEHLCAEIEYILRKRIADRAIETASISSRAKTLNSFLEKLQRKHYDDPFGRLTDLAGARVVCLYRGDIAKVADIIRSEFVVVEDVDKLGELAVDQFGYGARHFVVRLGKTSSGARYDDLKRLACEVQVRTVVQDAWAIIQHHMVYKREAQVPTQLQRKLNSLAGLFETVDDQFERIREERDAYLAGIRESASMPSTFLENELNLDSFKEYLTWAFPSRGLESWDGQARMVLDGLIAAGYKTLRDVDRVVKETAGTREALIKELGKEVPRTKAGTVPSNLEPALALALTAPHWEKLIPWGPAARFIRKFRTDQKSAG